MRRTTPALVVAVALAAASLPSYAAAQTGGTQHPAAGQPPPSGPPATTLDKAGISQQELDTYMRVREELMQNPNVAPMLRQREDLKAQALERYLEQGGARMSAEEFVRIHRTVQNDPELRAHVESASGAARSGAAPSSSPQ